jgi:uncharacterized protein YdaU (DUF1376 family)
MSFAYMPLYTGDYLRDTRHLTPLRHGVYMLLLMHCWDSKGPVPLDEQEAAGIANCRSADEIAALRYILDRHFVRMDDGWYNKRMAEEIAKAERLSTTRSAAGKRSAEVRFAVREQVFNKRSARVKQESVSPCHEKIKAVSTKKNLLSVIDTEAGQELPVEGSAGDWNGINLEDFE